MGGLQVLTASIAFAGYKVASWAEHPVESEAAGVEAFVRVVCGVFAIAPVLYLELLTLTDREKSKDGEENKVW